MFLHPLCVCTVTSSWYINIVVLREQLSAWGWSCSVLLDSRRFFFFFFKALPHGIHLTQNFLFIYTSSPPNQMLTGDFLLEADGFSRFSLEETLLRQSCAAGKSEWRQYRVFPQISTSPLTNAFNTTEEMWLIVGISGWSGLNSNHSDQTS